MKRLSLSVLILCLATVLTAAGQAPAASVTPKPAAPGAQASAPPTAKVAVIMFQAAVAQTNEFQRDLADLQKKYDPKRTQLKGLNDEIDKLTKQLQDQSAQLSEAERANRARTIDEKKKQLDRDTQDAQSDFQGDMQQVINSVASKVGALMTDYAKTHGYTLVLDASDEQNSTVLYAVDSTNITKQIIDAYNVKSGIPAPPPQPAGAGTGAGIDAPQPQPQK
jgi:outer membrane protein